MHGGMKCSGETVEFSPCVHCANQTEGFDGTCIKFCPGLGILFCFTKVAHKGILVSLQSFCLTSYAYYLLCMFFMLLIVHTFFMLVRLVMLVILLILLMLLMLYLLFFHE